MCKCVKDNKKHCGAVSSLGYNCTLQIGHKGKHIACSIRKHKISTWRQDYRKPRKTKHQSVCTWTYDNDGFYRTSCKRAFCFEDGNIRENGFVWCPYCKGKINHTKKRALTNCQHKPVAF